MYGWTLCVSLFKVDTICSEELHFLDELLMILPFCRFVVIQIHYFLLIEKIIPYSKVSRNNNCLPIFNIYMYRLRHWLGIRRDATDKHKISTRTRFNAEKKRFVTCCQREIKEGRTLRWGLYMRKLKRLYHTDEV